MTAHEVEQGCRALESDCGVSHERTMSQPIRIAVTGAAGQIGYALLFRIAAGEMLGPKQPLVLQLLEIPPAMDALRGVVMELEDCASPLLRGVVASSDPDEAFDGVEFALLVGSRPRGPGMERNELLAVNGEIFTGQGSSINRCAAKSVRVLVVGNPANTNCLIAQKHAPDIDPRQFSAMTRLDQNRAAAQLSSKLGCDVADVSGLAVWGNHSSTMFPDLVNAKVAGTSAMDLVSQDWYEAEFIPTIQQRGASIIAARGSSSAASAANAAVAHMRDWVQGSWGETVSMGVLADGSYGIADDVIFSFPIACKNGDWQVTSDLEVPEFSRERIETTRRELLSERAAVEHLL